MDHAGSPSFIAVLTSVAIASGATAALATVLALNAAGDGVVRRQADRWRTWIGSREGVAFEDASTEPCCCSQRSASHPSSSQPPNPPAESCRQNPPSDNLGSKPSPANWTNTQSRHPSEEVLGARSSKGFKERLEEVSEEGGGASQEEISSIDLRTPEKAPRPLDLSLGRESPVQSGKPDPEDPAKRKGYLSWDDYFMAVAFLSAQRSKDPNRQVGACIVSQERIILGIGYNGFPRGCSDDQLPWAKSSQDGDLLKTKYPYVCHAELNAILNRNHASAPGQKMYVTMFPCNECAKLIIQSGISEVIYYTDKGGHERDIGPGDPRPEVAYAASKRLLKMAGVKLWQHKPAKASITLEFR